MYESATEAAASVRAAFKARGWTSRQVSVRSEYFSMGSAINVTLKDGSIPFHVVKAVAEGKEKIDRDGFGEILSGCNRYVSVTVTPVAAQVKSRRYVQAVERAVALLNDPPDGILQPIIKGYYVGRDAHGMNLTLWGDSFIIQRQTAEEIAYHLAVYLEQYGEVRS